MTKDYQEFLDLVGRMRTAQRDYLDARRRNDIESARKYLSQCKQFEYEVDKAWKRFGDKLKNEE